MKSQLLESEHFGNGKRTYFIDFAQAHNKSDYIKITRSDRQADNSYKKNSICIFQEDFHFLIESLSMVFTSRIHGESKFTEKPYQGTANVTEYKPNGIKSWPAEMRPREKFLEGGPQALTDTELLALLIGSGTTKQTAVDLAGSILKAVDGDLQALSCRPVKWLSKFPGIGDAKAVKIIAALALSKRNRQQALALNPKVS